MRMGQIICDRPTLVRMKLETCQAGRCTILYEPSLVAAVVLMTS